MPLSALAQRPSGTHVDRQAAATQGFATRGAQELEQILNERRMTYFDDHVPQSRPDSCRDEAPYFLLSSETSRGQGPGRNLCMVHPGFR